MHININFLKPVSIQMMGDVKNNIFKVHLQFDKRKIVTFVKILEYNNLKSLSE